MDELRKLAEKATPGPWADYIDNYDTGRMFVTQRDTDGLEFFVGDMAPADAAYIAAVCPDVVLALLDERDRLRAALKYAVEAAAAQHRLGVTYGAAQWRIGLEEIISTARAALAEKP